MLSPVSEHCVQMLARDPECREPRAVIGPAAIEGPRVKLEGIGVRTMPPGPLSRCDQIGGHLASLPVHVFPDLGDHDGTFADRGGDTLDGARAHIAHGEYAGV